ncbi:MAG: alpha-1,2-fucosyltransferase [Desulfuromonadaceae bacterium]|nr:alpha-1,2-fucosyltransferase [Desulfuromonadaceae bacterium]MDD2848195.1 alpha-1,2-fucosyltransferase [Desulfuromonadaceae bacterium]MDD4130638.1 alpha-1,2-fucosyltransferase [Desulfuromonadaceae bacterium]
MVIAKIYGGLGNQMFQYAMARSVAERNGLQLKVDLSWFSSPVGTTQRIFGLDSFNIKLVNANESEIANCLALRKILGRNLYEAIVPFNYKKYVRTKDFQSFSEKYLRLKGDVYLEGYWTDERYFADNADIVRNEFTLLRELSSENSKIASSIDTTESISIHVRRGDYISNSQFHSIFNICDQHYYHRAIELISGKVSSPVFFIFSDDIDWARRNIKVGHDVVYVSGPKSELPHEELILMSRCKHNIIANSTFSWWGAWLNRNQKKVVVAPDKWVQKTGSYGTQIVPATWTTVSAELQTREN